MTSWWRRLRIPFVALLALLALWWHADRQWTTWQERARGHGFDHASFHYAVKVAADGGDPYDTRQLSRRARTEGTRGKVHPFFYPPPALLLLSWQAAWTLRDAYFWWYWIDEAAVLLCMLTLILWWRRLGWAVPLSVLAVLGAGTVFHDNHLMGQVNTPVLLITLVGLWVADHGRQGLGGLIVSVACMAKMAPALFVIEALTRRRWAFVFGAGAGAVGLSLAAIGVYGWETTRHFYMDVFPGFASGDYNGLRVPITLWANHSIPNVWIEAFPAEHRPWREVSPTAWWGARLTLLGLMGFALWRSLQAGDEPVDRALRAGGVGIAMLLVPLYTYEHHLVWAVPALVATAAAIGVRRLPWWALLLWVPAWAVWAVDLPWWNRTFDDVDPERTVLRWSIREGKMLGLLALGGLTVWALRPAGMAPVARTAGAEEIA